MKRPKAPRFYPPLEIDCPPCKHNCDLLWPCEHVKQCVHDPEPLISDRVIAWALVEIVHEPEPLISDRAIAWALVAICIALGIFALVGWL